jgi:hypothetical protein
MTMTLKIELAEVVREEVVVELPVAWRDKTKKTTGTPVVTICTNCCEH